jgi:hypothetical protein
MTLDGLFSRKGYRPAMALKRLEPKDYFVNGARSEILRRRRALLAGVCEDFIFEPEREEDRTAVIRFAGMFVPVDSVRTLRELGMVWELDFVLLNRDDSQALLAGASAFQRVGVWGRRRSSRSR